MVRGSIFCVWRPEVLEESLDVQYTYTGDPYLQVCGVSKLYLNSKEPNFGPKVRKMCMKIELSAKNFKMQLS